MLCSLQGEADVHHQWRYWAIMMAEQIPDLMAEEQSMVMREVKLQIMTTSSRKRRRVFSFEEKVYLWQPG